MKAHFGFQTILFGPSGQPEEAPRAMEAMLT